MRTLILSLAAALALPAAALQPGDWPSWRGPSANGSTTTGQYPTKWTPESAAWRVEMPGKGFSTPIVSGDRIYLTSPVQGQDAVVALDRRGKEVWTRQLGPESPPRHRTLASSCNASPVTDGKGIYARFRSGRLAAVEPDGKLRWQINLDEKFGPEVYFWDTGTSPVLTEDCVVVARMHGGDSWVAGFDKKTGAQRWLQKRNYQAPRENDQSYATPILFQHQGRPALLLWGADHLTAHSAADGKLLWSSGGFNPDGHQLCPPVATPVIHQGIVVVPAGRDDRNLGRIYGVRMGGSGDVTQSHRAWERPDLGVFCSSPVVYGGRVYLLRHRGGVVCLDPATGKTIWEDALPRGSASYYSSPVIANGVLYAAREDGMVFAARVGDRFELLGENAMGERIVSSPVPAGDCLLIRTEKALYRIAAGK